MLKRKFILQDIHTKEYASKNKEGGIVFYTDDISFAHLFDTKTEIYEFIKSTNKKLDELGQVIYFIIHELIY